MNKFTQNLISACGEDFQNKTRENISTFILWLQYLRCPQSNICGFCRKEGRFQRLYWQTVCRKKKTKGKNIFANNFYSFLNQYESACFDFASYIMDEKRCEQGKVGADSHLLIFIKFHHERKIFCEDNAITFWRVQGFHGRVFTIT